MVLKGNFSYNTYHRHWQDVQSKVDVISNQDLTNLVIDNGFSGTDFIDNRTNYNQYYVLKYLCGIHARHRGGPLPQRNGGLQPGMGT